ncbi:MAG: squalene/phytoene synthase family protein [Candidatus Zixiibacteriota bacterium]
MINTSDEEFEKILTNPILDIAARFWDEERYRAFQDCYRSMREIDDLVDHRKATGATITLNEQLEFGTKIQRFSADLTKGRVANDLSETIAKFKIPVWPWERLSKSMIYDLSHNGFSSFLTFLRYCEGAAIAPASVFVYLCGVRKADIRLERPDFDVRQGARALALFSYLVHIMRDLEKDQLRNLNYFSDDILQKCGLDKFELNELVRKKVLDERVAKLFSEYKKIAGYYQAKARETFKCLLPKLEPKYQLSLQIIYALYSLLFEKIDPYNQSFSETDLNLSPSEVQKRIKLTVAAFRPI